MKEYEELVYTGYTPFDPVYEQYLWDEVGLELLEEDQYGPDTRPESGDTPGH